MTMKIPAPTMEPMPRKTALQSPKAWGGTLPMMILLKKKLDHVITDGTMLTKES
jgi:hypothetical protein